MSFLGKLNPLKIAKAALSPVLAMDHVLRKVPAYKKVSQLAPMSKERDQALKAAHAVMGSAHSLVKRAASGDLHAKQAISSAIDAAAKGDPRAQAAVHALTAARLQQKLDPDLAFLTKRSAFLPARAASAGELAIVGMLDRCTDPELARKLLGSAAAGGLPRMSAVELVTAGGQWLSTAGGDVFLPTAYKGTAGARLARRQTLLMTPAIRAQLKTAAAKERAGQLPLGTTRRWAERAVSGFESAHGGAQTLREWLGQDPSLNIALK